MAVTDFIATITVLGLTKQIAAIGGEYLQVDIIFCLNVNT